MIGCNNLTCIQVDDVQWFNDNWSMYKDSWTIYSDDCDSNSNKQFDIVKTTSNEILNNHQTTDRLYEMRKNYLSKYFNIKSEN